ncbi:MAG: hypothetical protein ACKPGT_25545 [Microcystis sp.]
MQTLEKTQINPYPEKCRLPTTGMLTRYDLWLITPIYCEIKLLDGQTCKKISIDS